MFSSSSWVFTIVFALTGLYSLLRLAELNSTDDRSGSKVAELSHLLMSIAMIAMSWAWSGGPTSGSGVVQIVVFGLLTLFFGVRLAGLAPGHSRVHEGYHLVMNAAMVWMVAAMSQIMGTDTTAAGGSGAHHGDAGMAGMPGMGGTNATGGGGTGMSTPVWAAVVTYVFVALLAVAAVIWVRHIARPDTLDPEGSGPSGGSARAGDTTTASGTLAMVTRAPARTAGQRLDATCHLLMTLGMAGMLLAML